MYVPKGRASLRPQRVGPLCLPHCCCTGQPSPDTCVETADFEPGRAGWHGLRRCCSRLPDAVPWRLSSRDYLNHLDCGGTGAPIGSRKFTTPWDPPLGELLAKLQVRLTEEDRFDQLAEDLKAGVPHFVINTDRARRR